MSLKATFFASFLLNSAVFNLHHVGRRGLSACFPLITLILASSHLNKADPFSRPNCTVRSFLAFLFQLFYVFLSLNGAAFILFGTERTIFFFWLKYAAFNFFSRKPPFLLFVAKLRYFSTCFPLFAVTLGCPNLYLTEFNVFAFCC